MNSKKEKLELEDDSSPVEVKKEPVESEDIKDYAANTMNELLAIYGYDEKVDKSVTEDLQLHNFSAGKQEKQNNREGNRKSSCLSPREQLPGEVLEDNVSASGSSTTSSASGGSDLEVARVQLYTAIRSATEQDGQVPTEQQILCAWCQHPGVKRYTLNTATESKAFCSEKCFASCRRAYFKRNKVCDWCRHIRHTKEYVEFQSRDAKLQFCSGKCLNQYKMDVFCKETNTLGTSSMYPVDAIGKELASPSADGATVALPVMLTNKGKKPVGPKKGSETGVKASGESGSGAGSPLPMPTSASNGTVRQIQTMLQNRGASRVQAQADSTVANGSGIRTVSSVTSAVPQAAVPQAAINAAASVQAAAALQHSTFLGVPSVFQAPIGTSHGQVIGQAPFVVSGNQIPIIQQQSANVLLQSQPMSSNLTIPASYSPMKDSHAPTPNPNPNQTTITKQLPTSSSVLPPLTIVVPHPIFVPIPIPIPVPIPIRADVYDALKNSAMSTESPDQENSASNQGNGRDSGEARCQTLESLSTLGSKKEVSHSVLHDKRILKGLQTSSSSLKSTPNLLKSPFHASNGLLRSASLDFSLASQRNNVKTSLERGVQRHDRKVKTQLVLIGEEPSDTLEGRESSRKVREALRCHLNKRLSQSALNLTELGMDGSDGGALRRSCSMSLLHESGIAPLNSLGQEHHCEAKRVTSLTKPKRILDNCNRISEDIEAERELMIHEEDVAESGTDDRTDDHREDDDRQEEPSCKRVKLTESDSS